MPSMKQVREKMRRRSARTRHLFSTNRVHRKRPALPPQPRVTVSVAVRQSKREKKLLERAVESVLNQTYKNLIVVVTSDGEKTPSWEGCSFVNDPRVICWSLPTRHGPYYAHELARVATGSPLFAVQDSDDWSHPQRIELLVRALLKHDGDAAVPQNVMYDGNVVSKPAIVRKPTQGVGYRMSHFWVVRSDFIDEIGSYFTGDGHICHSDTFLTNLALDFGQVHLVPEALYHRQKRQGSLETSKETGGGSPIRKKVEQDLNVLYTVAHSRGLRYVKHELQRRRDSSPSFPLHLDTLKKKMPKATPPKTNLENIIELFPFTDWSISRRCCMALYDHCKQLGARTIVDFGSGASTMALAYYARESGAKVVSFEHDARFLEVTKKALALAGLREHVELRLVEIAHQTACSPTRGRVCSHAGYVVGQIPHGVDFVFIDGPPGTIGRRMTLPSIAGNLAPSWEAWLHDGCRPGEAADVNAWKQLLDFRTKLVTTHDSRGVFVLTSQSQDTSSAPHSAP